jgi:hydroxyacylglutathione hydrolase
MSSPLTRGFAKGLGSLPESTLGYERRTNWALAPMSEDVFVGRVLADQPDPPAYFGEMTRIDKEGPRFVGSVQRPERLSLEGTESFVRNGALVIDTRSAAEFAARHLPGTINIPLKRALRTWRPSEHQRRHQTTVSSRTREKNV